MSASHTGPTRRPTAPTQPVPPRGDARTDAGMLRFLVGAAVKENAVASSTGHSRGMSNLQTRLRPEAWVRNLTLGRGHDATLGWREAGLGAATAAGLVTGYYRAAGVAAA